MNIALIVAAGSGTRMGMETPKQFVLVKDKPLLFFSVNMFETYPELDSIVIVTNKEYISEVEEIVKEYNFKKVKAIVVGGETRQDSVYNGLIKIKEFASKDDIVLIHDSARPLVNHRIIYDNIKTCLEFGAVDTVIQASDTIVKSSDGSGVDELPLRKELYQAQTPQTFKLGLILDAHEYAKTHHIPDVTDDVKLVISLGKQVHIVEGSKLNFKITTPEDLDLLEALL